jgi:hypothetical protein
MKGVTQTRTLQRAFEFRFKGKMTQNKMVQANIGRHQEERKELTIN